MSNTRPRIGNPPNTGPRIYSETAKLDVLFKLLELLSSCDRKRDICQHTHSNHFAYTKVPKVVVPLEYSTGIFPLIGLKISKHAELSLSFLKYCDNLHQSLICLSAGKTKDLR